jgi:uncharacterized membrane protein (UPF0127 family)
VEKFTSKSGKTMDVEIANTFMKRFLGLMGRKTTTSALWLAPCSSIHMFFMHFPIDVVFTDKKGVVVKVVKALKPGQFAMGGKNAWAVLEIPATYDMCRDLKTGDQLDISTYH